MSFPNLGLGQLGSSPYFYNYPSLVPYANPPTNYLGTTLFLSYIFLALILTSYITITLFQRYQSTITFPLIASSTPPPRQIRDVRARHVKIYASLASISFAMLSYHMLNFLITNYGHWSGGAARMLRSWEGISRDVFVLKQWMLNSTLFEHFARELVDDGPSTVWMQVSVLGTWFCSMWMGGKANERGFGWKTMLPYVMLGQILPISFTLTLFLVHLHLASPDLAPAPPASESPKKSLSESSTSDVKLQEQGQSYPTRKTSLLLPTILLNAVLLSLAPLRQHALFIPLVLFTRLLLLLPYTGRISTRSVEVDRCMMVSGGFVMANLMALWKGYGIWDVLSVLRGGEFGGHAVRTFAWDSIVAGAVGRVLAWGGGV